jgi:cytochrome d ubiquinol oxidase subunit II
MNVRRGTRMRHPRRRSTTVAGSGLMVPLLRARAPHLWHSLPSPRAAPVVAVGVAAALLSGWALHRHRFRPAHAATAEQMASLLAGRGSRGTSASPARTRLYTARRDAPRRSTSCS